MPLSGNSPHTPTDPRNSLRAEIRSQPEPALAAASPASARPSGTARPASAGPAVSSGRTIPCNRAQSRGGHPAALRSACRRWSMPWARAGRTVAAPHCLPLTSQDEPLRFRLRLVAQAAGKGKRHPLPLVILGNNRRLQTTRCPGCVCRQTSDRAARLLDTSTRNCPRLRWRPGGGSRADSPRGPTARPTGTTPAIGTWAAGIRRRHRSSGQWAAGSPAAPWPARGSSR